jgi:hypothetical protein
MEALAYHDAGQAVAAFSLLNRAVQVTIAPGETALHARLFTPPREDEHWAIEDGIVAVLAGSTAVRQHPGFLLPTGTGAGRQRRD